MQNNNGAPLSNGMGTSKKWNSSNITMSHPDKKRRRQLTKPMGLHKEFFDELRLNKALHKRYKEESVTHNKSKSSHGPIKTVIILMPNIYWGFAVVPGIVLSTLHILTHGFLGRILWSRGKIYLAFTEEGSKKTKWLNYWPRVKKPKSWDLNPSKLAPESALFTTMLYFYLLHNSSQAIVGRLKSRMHRSLAK